MIFAAIKPAFVGLANWMIPLQIGAPDMALPRLNNFSFWMLPFAFVLLLGTYFVPAARRDVPPLGDMLLPGDARPGNVPLGDVLFIVYTGSTAFRRRRGSGLCVSLVQSLHEQERPMERIEKEIEVACPLSTVYNQWTQFEEFPRFMSGVKEVRQLDDTHVHWHAEIWGRDVEWDVEITEQDPDKRISWKSTSGPSNAGTVRFEPLGTDRTRVRLVMAYEPDGAVENLGDKLGLLSAQVQTTVEQFKRFIESRGTESGAWRGQVDDSRTVEH